MHCGLDNRFLTFENHLYKLYIDDEFKKFKWTNME